MTILALSIPGSIFAQTPNHVPQNGLVAWYSFNGNANDASGNNHDGQVYGATSVSDQFGNANSAYYFNGTQSNYIKVPHDNDLNFSDTASYTISTWIKPEDNTANGHAGLLTKWNENTYSPYPYSIRIKDEDNECSKVIWANHSSQATNHTYGLVDKYRYSHVVVKVQNNKSYLYINTHLVDSTTFPSMNLQNTNDLYIGKRTSSASRCYKGVIENLGIWSRALTICEIQNLYMNKVSTEITNQPHSKTVTSGNTATFSITTTAPQGSTLQWQTNQGYGFNDLSNASQYSGVNSDSLIIANVSSANDNQLFRCIVTYNNCTDTSSTASLNVTGVGIKDNNQTNLISVYPNPTKGNVTVDLEKTYQNIEVEIFSPYGQFIRHKTLKNTSEIDLTINQTPGVYFIRITTDEARSKVIKVVKTND